MSDEQWLREALAGAVPDPPANPDRAEASVAQARRARRRTTTAVAVGTGLAVAALALVGPALTRGSDPAPSDPADTTSPYGAPACPPPPRPSAPANPLDQVDPDALDAVPEGATSVRLCQGPGMPFDVPNDALVTSVEELTDAVNGLEQIAKPEVCTSDLGPGYRLVFGYDDGSEFVVSGKLYGCRELVVGSGYRADAGAAWDDFTELLRKQRTDLGSPATPSAEALDCGRAGTTSPVARPEEMQVAALCPAPFRSHTQIGIAEADLETLVQDLKHYQRSSPGPVCRGIPVRLIGLSAWGDRIMLESACGTSSFATDAMSWWRPGPPAREVFDRLLSDRRGR